MAKYEDMLDEMEEKNKLLTLKLKRAEEDAREWRIVATALAHAVALIKDKKQPDWMKQYYKEWETKHKGWFGV
jgi:predicted nucleic acid-binding protein